MENEDIHHNIKYSRIYLKNKLLLKEFKRKSFFLFPYLIFDMINESRIFIEPTPFILKASVQ